MSRPLQTIILALAASQTVHAGLVAPRAPTPFAKPQPDPVHGWSPNPTHGPESPWAYGSIDSRDLFGRENTQLTDFQVCGWTSGLSQSPISCPGSTDGCGYLVGSGSPYNVWCCPYTASSDGHSYADFENACPWITRCLPYSDSANLNTGTNVLVNSQNHVISCPTQAPECTTVFLQGPSTDIYFNYGCGTKATTISAFQSYTVEAEITTTSRSSSSTSTVPTSTVGSSTTSSPSSSPTDTGSSTNVGAIAGGTVGGVAAVAIIGGIIAWLIYRKKVARRPAMREVSQYTGSTYMNPSTGGSTFGGGSAFGGGAEGQSIAPSTRK